MAYTTNPRAPKVRRDAAQLVLQKGIGVRTVARKFGVSPGTITKWVKKAKKVGIHPILTRSSRPRHSPKRLSDEVRDKVGKKRIELGRSIEVIHSRTAFARCYKRATTYASLDFLRRVEKLWSFSITCIQSDHGPEFGAHFTRMAGMRHRHSRVRTPNDNAQVERFNRTLQDEYLKGIPFNIVKINKALQIYLHYYNDKRHHFSLKFRAPSAILDSSSVSKV
jgi:transposase InsO family protein